MRMVICYRLLFVFISHYRNLSEGFIHTGFPALGKNHNLGRERWEPAFLCGSGSLGAFRPASSHVRATDLGQDRLRWLLALSTQAKAALSPAATELRPLKGTTGRSPESDCDSPQGFARPTPKWGQVGAGDAGRAPGGSMEGAGPVGARR